jgi:hypothetical protein
MLDPAVILPMAFGAIVALTAAAVAFQLWLDHTVTWNPWMRFGIPAPGSAPAPRHRLGEVADPYRPHPAPVFRPGIQVDTVTLAARIEEVRSRAGNTMWSWSDATWSADTRELAAIR